MGTVHNAQDLHCNYLAKFEYTTQQHMVPTSSMVPTSLMVPTIPIGHMISYVDNTVHVFQNICICIL